MKRFFALILVGLLVAGCKSQAPVCDPFFGRTTIPPPATGSITGRPADPGYQPPPLAPQSGACPPVVQMPAQPSAQSAPLNMPGPVNQPAPATVRPAIPPATQPGPSQNYPAPRPSSTVPGASLAPRPTPLASSSPPAARSAATSVAPSFTNVAATRPGNAADDRMPKPVDDSPAAGGQTNQPPITRTIQPRGVDDASNRPVDIMDLPASR
jgi:hypothetical protein